MKNVVGWPIKAIANGHSAHVFCGTMCMQCPHNRHDWKACGTFFWILNLGRALEILVPYVENVMLCVISCNPMMLHRPNTDYSRSNLVLDYSSSDRPTQNIPTSFPNVIYPSNLPPSYLPSDVKCLCKHSQQQNRNVCTNLPLHIYT